MQSPEWNIPEVSAQLEAAGWIPSGPSGQRDALWGRCESCGLRTNKVDLSVHPPTAVCRDCDNSQPVRELLKGLEDKRGLPIWTLEEEAEAAKAAPEIDWLVGGLLTVGGISLLVAPPKAGKSTAVRCLAAAIAGGRCEWLGRPVAREGVVIHLALEEQRSTVRGHFARLNPGPGQVRVLRELPPAGNGRNAKLRESVEDLRPALVIVDPLQRWVTIQDGNDYSGCIAALTPLIELAREHDTHVMLVHHSRKGGGKHGEETLGSQALFGSVDVGISLKVDGEGRRSFDALGRDGVDVAATRLKLDESGWVTAGETGGAAPAAAMAERVLKHLQETGEDLSAGEIIAALSARKAAVYAALNELEGRIIRTGSGIPGDAFRYADPRGSETVPEGSQD